MNHKEEQEQEIEALKVIFLDEFILTYESPYKFELTIHTDRDEDDLNFIKVKLIVEFPETYPEVPPKASFKNLSEMLLEPSDFHKCEDIFQDEAEQLIGSPMIFQIVEKIKEHLQGINNMFVEEKKIEEQKVKDEEE